MDDETPVAVCLMLVVPGLLLLAASWALDALAQAIGGLPGFDWFPAWHDRNMGGF